MTDPRIAALLAEALRTLPVPSSFEEWQAAVDRSYEEDAAAILAKLPPDFCGHAAGLRALHERLSNDAKPKRRRCECGLDMDSHSGGWALLHHDFFIVDRLSAALAGGSE